MNALERQRQLYDAIDKRREELGWLWRDVETATALTYETFRALRDTPRTMRASTRRQIETGLGWTARSVDAVLDGGAPKTVPGWRPAVTRPGSPSREDHERSLLAALGLDDGDLAEAQQRYTAGIPWLRVLADAVAQLFEDDITPDVRELLLTAAARAVREVFAAERREMREFTQLRQHASRSRKPGHRKPGDRDTELV